ncbi:MAG TPA: BBE domain-containing protein, partial [Candidatus Limnocylindrales bacterium]|nr:BBE domain-containing protein [Candidatus Limnocylindrales bacterium]
GLTIDSLLEAEVVTADGAIVRTNETEEPELFWAIRGGGGNFGVATRFVFRLHPVDPMVGGLLVLPATPDTIVGFMDAAHEAPEELSAIANVMPAPPLPFLPEDVVGTPVIFSMAVHVGDVDAGQAALTPFRSLATPLADLTRPMPYPEVYPPDDDSYRPTASSRTMFVDRIDRAAGERIMDALDASDAPLRAAQLRVLGGAVARVPADATAFAHRASPIMVNVAAFWQGEEDRPRREAWVADLASALHTGDDGAYVNFLGDEGPERVRAAYPGATWGRLRAAKRRYDPTNLFRRNQNIVPG